MRRAGLVPAGRYAEAAYQIRDTRFWSAWALRALLALGAGHLLAGIIFFFAFNWADMPDFAKFAVIEAGIVIAAAGALIARLDRAVGQALLIAASVLTGVLLAVFGQVYQTGADAYELFVSWTLLILPWALISRSAPHWIVWLAVACSAIGFYGTQILVPQGVIENVEINLLLGAVLVLALALREIAVKMGSSWLSASWVRYVLVFAGLGFFFVPAVTFVFEIEGTLLSVIVFASAAIACAAVYYRLLPDFGGFALPIGFAAFFLMAVGGKLIGEAIGYDEDEFSILTALALLTVWCVAVTGGLARLLTQLRRKFREGEAEA